MAAASRVPVPGCARRSTRLRVPRMTDRQTPNPPAWVHTRLSNLEAAVGDLVVRVGTVDVDREWLKQRQLVAFTDILTRLAALEGAATPVCAPVAAATGAYGLREPGEAETAYSDRVTLRIDMEPAGGGPFKLREGGIVRASAARCDECVHSRLHGPERRESGYVWCSGPQLHESTRVMVQVRQDHYCAAFGGQVMSEAYTSRPPRRRHDCANSAPATVPADVPEKSLWRCPDCGRRWRLVSKRDMTRPPDPGYYAEGESFRDATGSVYWRAFRARIIGRIGT